MSSKTDFTQTPYQAFVSGAIAGALTPVSYQALWTLKTAKQTNTKLWEGKFVHNITKNMKNLNIGLGASSGNNASNTALQNSVNNFLLKNYCEEVPSEGEKVITSCTTGIITSPLSTCTENVMIQKGKMKLAYTRVFKNMYANEGLYAFQKGLLGTAGREAVFVCAYACLAGYLSKKIDSKVHNKVISDLIGGACAGFSGALVSQPFDTIKTKIQDGQHWKVKDLMKGGLTRASYCGIAVAVFTLINEKIKAIQKLN